MAKYVAFLRAINVSGHRIIKMADLKEMFLSAGLKNVTTYIQSGNVLFESSQKDIAKLTTKIEKHLEKELGYSVEVFVRSIPEIEAILQFDPFSEVEKRPKTVTYLALLTEPPEDELKEKLASFNNHLELFHVAGHDVYILCHKDTNEKLQFSNMFIEKKLKQLATTRNFTTIRKLLALAQ